MSVNVEVKVDCFLRAADKKVWLDLNKHLVPNNISAMSVINSSRGRFEQLLHFDSDEYRKKISETRYSYAELATNV